MSRLRELAKNIVRSLLRPAGIDVVHYSAQQSESYRLKLLLANEGIDLVLDVGANEGQFAETVWELGYRGRIVSFEPLSDAFALLAAKARSRPAWTCRNLALADVEEMRTINVAGNSQSSSFLPMLAQHSDSAPASVYVRQETVRCVTLDSIWQEIGAEGARVLLKIDVQGLEREVLEGAKQSLAKVSALQLELSMAHLYDGQPMYDEMIAYLRQRGFDLFDLDRVFSDPATGRLLQMDGTFLKAA